MNIIGVVYVLIVFTYGANSTVAFQEFNSIETCQTAARFIVENRVSGTRITCLPK